MSSPLQKGTRLGRYEIRAQLGSGGMGEVYLAWDTLLDRKVALKILPEEAASNPLSMQRFVQEAKAASALNHPNILTIYEIGTEPGTHFIATEFIDGETLRRKMAQEGLTIERAIDTSLQVASALATAHAAGIIHRDVKPENIMLRRDGIVKVLDFGLAKLSEHWRSDNVDPDAATKAMVQTQPGVIVGTTAYMSPEQTRALDIDTRTDIWSLGVMLYEMLAGRTPFKGATPSDTSAAILRSDPIPLSESVPEIPFELERIVSKALQKDREERYQVIKDLELDLKSLKRALDLGTSQELSAAGQSRSQRSLSATRLTGGMEKGSTQASAMAQLGASRRGWLFLGIILIAIAALVGVYLWRQRATTNVQLSNLTVVQLVSRKNDLGETATHARFSPDGKFIAYSSTKDGSSSIWIKQVSGGEPFTNKSAPGIAASPIWSPDGQQIAFVSKRDSQSGIWTMPAFGGAPSLVVNLENPTQGLVAWSRVGQIYFISRGNLFSVDVATNQIQDVCGFDASKPVDRTYSLSPDGQHIAYSDLKGGQRDIFVVSRSGGEPIQITNDKSEDTHPVWTPDGDSIVFSSKRNGTKQLFLAYLDSRPVVQLTVNDSNSDVLDVSPDGTRILYATTGDESDLWSVKVDQGKESKLTTDIGLELWPDVSPDGSHIVFQASKGTSGISPFNCALTSKAIGAENKLQLAQDGFAARWSPDGKLIAFLRFKDGEVNLWVVHAEGGDARQITTGGISFGGFVYLPFNRVQTHDFQWTADSRSVVYCADRAGTSNVWQAGIDGAPGQQLSDNATQGLRFFDPQLSPDGQTVAWTSLTPPGGGKKLNWSIWSARDRKSSLVFQSESILDLVGWSQSGTELIFKSVPGLASAPNLPVDVKLFSVSISGGNAKQLSELKATYFQNIQLAPGRNEIAFVTRQEGADSLRVVSGTGGTPKTIITNSDTQSYLSGLAWSADRSTIYYGKQASWTVLSMIENFKSK